MAGVTVPAETKILIGEVEALTSAKNLRTRSFLLYLPCTKQKHLMMQLQKLNSSWLTADMVIHLPLYINVNEKKKWQNMQQPYEDLPYPDNTPSSQGGIGDLYNFKLVPSLTLGCGSWGGNSVSENVGVKHLINIKTVAERRENMLWMRTPEKVYFKKGCLPVALDELGMLWVRNVALS